MEKEEEEKKCEICGEKVIKIEIRDIETQQLEEKEEEKGEEKCLLCDEKATMECVTCGLMVCENKECQQRFKIQHEKARRNQHELELKPITTTKKKEEGGNVGECGLIGHEKKKLKYFCEEDDVPVCSQCLLIGLCCFFSFTETQMKHKNKKTQDHIVKEKYNTNVRQSKKQQRNRGRNFQRKKKK